MLRILMLLVTVVCCTAPVTAGQGSSWMFRRSYYSHQPARPVRVARPNVVGGPQFTRPQGEHVSVGYRFSRNSIIVGGITVDHQYQFDSWIQSGSQY